jgi:acetoin utilization deacetylase AcuC-like enzyme
MAGKTLFITHALCEGHSMGGTHPEAPARIRAIIERLEATGAMSMVERSEAPALVDESMILRAHDAQLWEKIKKTAPKRGSALVSKEAIMGPGTMEAILRGVGGAVEAVERVVRGDNPNAFVAIRPPGHHATRSKAMGFCFVNNVAVAALRALDLPGIERVAVVDIDVHHGNGTEDILAGNPRAMMASTFGSGIYPGNGDIPMASNMANAPLEPYLDSTRMRERALRDVLAPLDAFAPSLILVSAGYDAHEDDAMGNQTWTDDDYQWWFEQLSALARRHAGGKLVAVLEGGYELGSLARCVERSLQGMQGAPA